jgi:DNA-binding XRE family transcriptional regulator
MPNGIKQRREALGLTQAQLARKVSISAGYLNRIENETRPVNVKIAIRIARALNVAVEDIFFD